MTTSCLSLWGGGAVANLFVDVDGVEGALVVLQPDGGRRHGLVVLGTDDDDDQVLFLGKEGGGGVEVTVD